MSPQREFQRLAHHAVDHQLVLGRVDGASKEFFVPMAECGRAARIARCQAENNCSDLGDVLMRYADDLEQSVKQKQMSDAEAYRRLVEYETQLAFHLQKEGQAQAAADALRLRSR